MPTPEPTFFQQFIDAIIKIPTKDWTITVAVLVIGGILTTAFRMLWNKLKPMALRTYQATRKLARIQSAISTDGDGLWLPVAIKTDQPKGYKEYYQDNNKNRIPIIVVANLKGGVGKTTTSANLIAHYAISKGEKVLGIDLDYQGSLTRMSLEEADYVRDLAEQSDGAPCRASALIRGQDFTWLKDSALRVKDCKEARLVPSFYSLATSENRIMLQWLLDPESRDIRYDIARLLHNEKVGNRFDRVIIDAPPRLTTACIQALCAATHVLIPTVLDDLSAEAVGTFATQLQAHQALWPNLRIVGVLGTMTDASTVDQDGTTQEGALSKTEIDSRKAAEEALNLALNDANSNLRSASFLPTECFTPNKAELSKAAGIRIAYASTATPPAIKLIKASFARLGDEIDSRIGWTKLPAAK